MKQITRKRKNIRHDKTMPATAPGRNPFFTIREEEERVDVVEGRTVEAVEAVKAVETVERGLVDTSEEKAVDKGGEPRNDRSGVKATEVNDVGVGCKEFVEKRFGVSIDGVESI
jgi:hypothetical protein